MIDTYDKREGYCRMLGHVLTFHYCRTMKEGLPCGRILDCWFEVMPVQQFIEKNYSEEERKIIFDPPKQKMISLLEIIEKAQKKEEKK